jgi:UDP-3-O-[3-hydroxymyristoyl] glucosamine N-acyltransferase
MNVKDIAEHTGLELEGDPKTEIAGVQSLDSAGPEHLTFLLDPKAERSNQIVGCLVCRAVPKDFQARSYLIVEDPRKAMPSVLSLFENPRRHAPGVHPNAIVEEQATLAEGASVLPFAYIGRNARIGRNSVIHPFAYLGEDSVICDDCTVHPFAYVGDRCVIGHRVILHPGSVIGADGFGFVKEKNRYVRIPQIGRVVIEDDCEIGACSAVDRATLGETRIKRGTKIDNLVMVAHNVRIGEDMAIAGQSGIAGSSRVGSRVILAGQVGISDHVEIADGVVITAKTGVGGDIRKRGVYSGYFARDRAEALRAQSLHYRLPELLERIRRIERTLNLGEETDDPDVD